MNLVATWSLIIGPKHFSHHPIIDISQPKHGREELHVGGVFDFGGLNVVSPWTAAFGIAPLKFSLKLWLVFKDMRGKHAEQNGVQINKSIPLFQIWLQDVWQQNKSIYRRPNTLKYFWAVRTSILKLLSCRPH